MESVTWDEIKDHFPETMSAEVVEFIDNGPLLHSRYIFFYRDKSDKAGLNYLGYCSHCKETSSIDKPKQNESIICPNCMSRVTAKDNKYPYVNLYDYGYGLYYFKSCQDPKVMVAIGMDVNRDYRNGRKNVQSGFNACVYYIFDLEKGASMYTPQPSWRYKDGLRRFDKRPKVYPLYRLSNINRCFSIESIKTAVKGTPFQYSCWEEFNHEDMTEFFALFAKYPKIEYFTKLGLKTIIEDRLEKRGNSQLVNWKASNMQKALKLSKQELNYLKSEGIEIDLSFLWRLKEVKKQDWGLEFREAYKLSCMFTTQYEFDYLVSLSEHINPIKLANYLEKQAKLNDRLFRISSLLSSYKDYIRECKELKLNLTDESVLTPRNLHQAHLNTTKQIQFKKDKELEKKIKAQLKELGKLKFSNGSYFIRAASGTQELIDEGKALNHCVGGYARSYALAQTIIMVLRKVEEPNVPFFTVEIRNRKVVQCYGLKNRYPDEPVKEFMDMFTKSKLEKKRKSKSEGGVACQI